MTPKTLTTKSTSWLETLLPQSGETPCLGLQVGRENFWVSRTDSQKVEWCEKHPLPQAAFSGSPSSNFSADFAQALAPFFGKKEYETFQVALSDPAVRLEVFEVEKVPASQKDLDEFLNWRFNQGKEGEKQPLAFTTQVLGQEGGKTLLLAMALDARWKDCLNQAFRLAGARPSVVDMAFSHRFNFFHDRLKAKGGSGALLTLEPEFWSLAVWDKELRPRFVRSKWWDKEGKSLKDIPLSETVLEVERNIRSYVHSGKDRSVESLAVCAPEDWLAGALKAVESRTGGDCEALSLGAKGSVKGLTPSVAAAGAER